MGGAIIAMCRLAGTDAAALVNPFTKLSHYAARRAPVATQSAGRRLARGGPYTEPRSRTPRHAMIADIVQTGLTSWWAPALAFVAGLVSFASPCVFPLVPGYVSFVSGERPSTARPQRRLLPILLFIAGFTIVFTLLGAFASAVRADLQGRRGPVDRRRGRDRDRRVHDRLRARGAAPITLYTERRPFLEKVRPGRGGGVAAGHGVRGGVDAMHRARADGHPGDRGHGEHAARGIVLLLAYSLGLGVPFLLVGLGVQRFMGAFGWVRRHYALDRRCLGRAPGRGGRAVGHGGVHPDRRAARAGSRPACERPHGRPACVRGRP